MKLILNSLNYSPELTGIGKYNGEMCPELVKRDMDVTAIVAPPYYPEWEVHEGFSNGWFNTQYKEGVKVIRSPLYVPKQVTTLKRIVHLASFSFSSGLALLGQLFKKPDVIVLVQPTLFCAPMALIVGKLTGAKTVMHVQDYEIDAMFGLGMLNDGLAVKLIKGVERFIFKRFDAVSTISYSMIDNAIAKGVDESNIIHFPNWSDTEFVTPTTSGDALKAEWGFNASDKVVLYAGNIGQKQGLEVVLTAAKHYQANTDVKFVLVGTGSYVETLKNMAEAMALNNVFFLPLQPWEKVPQMLALADIHLVVQKKGAADAVLPSKLTNILSAGGHALVTAEPKTELGKIADNHPGIFTCVEPENDQAFIEGIQQLLDENSEASKQGEKTHNKVARDFAEQYLAKDKILDQFVSDLDKLVNRNRQSVLLEK